MNHAVISLTEGAIVKIRDLQLKDDLADTLVRVTCVDGGLEGYMYNLRFVRPDEQTDADILVEHGGVRLLVDTESVPNLRGATMDFIDSLNGSGFKFENPNIPTKLNDPLVQKVVELIQTRVNPNLAAHGGSVQLVDLKDGTLFLKFGGGCHGCSQVDLTVKEGIEKMLRAEVPEIEDIVDVTDHDTGENPYYQ